MRLKIYNFLVNRHSGIRSRYHRLHDNGNLLIKLISYVYLLWLNFCYYVLQCRFLGREEEVAVYEEKKLLERAESEARLQEGFSMDEAVERLSQYDIISFDIFDTLILRPFAAPTDLFHFLGLELGRLDIKRIRSEQEAAARKECFAIHGHYEVTLQDIWKKMERETGISAERGMQLEQDLERKFCYANSFMLEVFRRLQKEGKRMIAVSDMYLSGAFLKELLELNEYSGIDSVYVSCEYGCGKGDGGLFRKVRSDMSAGARMIHVGDNEHSDVQMAQKCDFDSLYYPNVNKLALAFRAYDMSPVIGGAYRGIVDNHLYSGLRSFSMEYEYGFIYGGLFVVGYCNFIHTYCQTHQIDRLLFLSRDGDILKQVYDRMFPEDSTAYVYWSRAAAVKLMAEHDRYDFFRRLLYHKVGQGYSLEKVLTAMKLEQLSKLLSVYVDRDVQGVETGIRLELSHQLTNGNVEAVKRFLLEHFEEIIDIYRIQSTAAKKYFEAELAGAEKAVAVDIGWAGSGALSLAYLVERVWKLPCEITGLVAGTNTVHNAEPEASEIFLQTGKLVAYLFSQAHNRDVMKKHDLNKDYNVFWELLLSSPTRQFLGFGLDEQGEVKLNFGDLDANQEGIREIQRGILDFAEEYLEHFGEFPYMLDISGRDAYAPMLLASGHGEKYLRAMESRFDLKVGV